MSPSSGGGFPSGSWVFLLLQDLGNSGVCCRQNVWLAGCNAREVSGPREVSIAAKEGGKKSVPGKGDAPPRHQGSNHAPSHNGQGTFLLALLQGHGQRPVLGIKRRVSRFLLVII